MAALSAVVFTLSWWLGLYLLARDPGKPVLVLTAVGLGGFAAAVALDAVRTAAGPDAAALSRMEAYLVVLPGIAPGAAPPARRVEGGGKVPLARSLRGSK